jgi:hypothetical protein
MPYPAIASRPAARIAYAGLLAGVAAALAWFTLPALGATYNEGFQTSIVMNAYAILHGGLADVDPLHGLNNDFMVYTRLGVSIVLAGLIKLGLPAAAAFRLLMLGSLGLLVAANAGLLAWRYRIHPLLACVPALLFPGLFESAWFFNDNVLSAALSSTAILLFWSRVSLPATAGAAALWGLAVACRSDAALIAPAFAVLGWYALPNWGARLRHALVAGPIAVAIPVLAYAAFGLNILDILPLTRRATELWARKETWAHILQPVINGFSLPGLLAMAVGAVSILRHRRRLEMLLCLAVPLLYALAYGRMLTEVRYLLPLTPFFGILMMEGWNAVQAASGSTRRVAGAAFAVALLACFVPPVFTSPVFTSPVFAPPGLASPGLAALRPLTFMVADHDMPRPPLGRFWSPVLGMWWNRTLDEGATALAGALEADVAKASARPDRTALVVSTYWSSDRMVDLILREHGFALAQADAPEACRQIGEMFTRDGVKVVHLRPHLPMTPTERAELNWRVLAVPCLKALGTGDAESVLVAGWMGLLERPAGLAAPGVVPLLTPALDINPLARSIAARRYSYYVAEVPVAAVPPLLEPALDAAEVEAAQAALADGRIWSGSKLVNVR